jgi:hypothetical protein
MRTMNKDRWMLLGVVLLLTALVGVLSLFIFPWAGERFAEWGSRKLTDHLGTDVSFRSVGLTSGGRIVVEELLIADPLEQEETFFYSPRVEVTLNPMNLIQEGINLSRVSIRRPYVSIRRREDGKWNVQSFRRGRSGETRPAEAETSTEEKGDPFRLRIHEIVLENCVTRLSGMFGEEILTVLDHRGALEIAGKRQEIYLFDTDFNSTFLTLTDMTTSGKLIVEDKVLTFEEFHVQRDETELRLGGAIDFNGEDTIDLRIERGWFNLDHIPPRYGLRHRVEGFVELELALTGFVRSPDIEGRIHNADGVMFDYPFANVSALFRLGEGEIGVNDLSADFLSGSVEGDVTFYLRESPRAFRVDLDVREIDVAAMPLMIPNSFATNLNGNIVAYGAGFQRRNHSSTVLLDLEASRFRGVLFESIQAQVLSGEGGFHVVSSTIGLDGGTIELTGNLSSSSPDVRVKTEAVPISTLMDLLDLTYDLDGELHATVSIRESYIQPSVGGQVVVRNGDVHGWRFAGLEGDIDISRRNDRPIGNAYLRAFMLSRGAIRAKETRLVARFDPGGIRLDSLVIQQDDSNSAMGSADLRYDDNRIQVSTDDLRFRRGNQVFSVVELRAAIEPSDMTLAVEVDVIRLNAAGGEASISGNISWPGRIELTTDVRSVHLEALGSPNWEIEGVLDLGLSIGGRWNDPVIELTAHVQDPGFQGVLADSLVAEAGYADGHLLIGRCRLQGGGNDATISGEIPLQLSLHPFLFEGLPDDSLEILIALDRFDLPMLNLLTEESEFSGGEISGAVRIGGTLGRPEWSGGGELRGGEGVVNRTNTYFYGMNALYSVQDQILDISSLETRLMRGGILTGNGRIQLDGLRPAGIDFVLIAEDYSVNQVRYVSSLVFDADIRIEGPLSAPEVTGEVAIHGGVLDIPAGGGSETNEEEGNVPFALRLDLRADNDLWIRNNQSNIEIALDMQLVTRNRRIVPVGDIEIIRGTYTYYGAIFDIETGDNCRFTAPTGRSSSTSLCSIPMGRSCRSIVRGR